MNQHELIELLKNIDAYLGEKLSDQIAAIYTYGSNNKILHNPLISNELDLVFVLKTRTAQSKRNSDINRDAFNFFVISVTKKLGNTRVIFNGEYPKNGDNYGFFIDILIDNIPSISEQNPTSKITSKLEKELIWGRDVYSELSHIEITDSDLSFLAKQKIDYLDRIYSKRDDKYAIKTYSKGLEFTYWLYKNYGSNKYGYDQEICELNRIMKADPIKLPDFVKECFDRLISNA